MTTLSHPALIALGILVLLCGWATGRGPRRRQWRRPTPRRSGRAFLDLSDHGDQLKAVEAAILSPRKPVNWSAAGVLKLLEELVKGRSAHHYRVFAEVSLGAFVAAGAPKGQEHIGTLAFRSGAPQRAMPSSGVRWRRPASSSWKFKRGMTPRKLA